MHTASPAPVPQEQPPQPPNHHNGGGRKPFRGVEVASYLLMAAMLFLVLHYSLLPGLLSCCLGFLATRWLAVKFTWLRRRFPRKPGKVGFGPGLAATLVILAPMVLIALALSHSRTYIVDAPQQYKELLDFLADTVLELRQKLPEDLGAMLPAGAEELQKVMAAYLGAKAGALAMAGRAWLTGLLYAYVGLIIGTLAAVRHISNHRGPLAIELIKRITLFGEAFRQIVAAQFWIASFNTVLTALFLLAILPIWDLQLPYTPALITLTFFAGLIPIVGNLLCNAVITLVGLSVSPAAAAACLLFLILIHKAEYVINAKVVGTRTHMGVWELLAVMFVAEAIFGPSGLVAAPLFYAYLKKELEASHLV